MTYQDAIKQISAELNLPLEVIKRAYESYWEFIRTTIQSLPLKEDLTEEQFKKLRTNFNIPSIGKMSCTYDRYVGMKKHYHHIQKLRANDNNNKESQTSV